jgi:hypothetical protein
MIRHAMTGAVGCVPITVIGAALVALLVAPVGLSA